jgi:hypothetical protein
LTTIKFEVTFIKDQKPVQLVYSGRGLAFAMAKRMQRRQRRAVVTHYISVKNNDHKPTDIKLPSNRGWWRQVQNWEFKEKLA